MSNNTADVTPIELALRDLEELCMDSNSAYQEFMSSGYKESSRHYLTSSSDLAAGAVAPSGEEDLAKIIQIIGKHKVPFAVKGGGHSMVPNFSSTSGGVQISMSRFDKMAYDPNTHLLKVGAGCLWGAVYRRTARYGRCVVGGANPAVGVAGFLLGGGYSPKTGRLGLGIDHIKAYRIVTPDGIAREVSDESTGESKELYQALRGGANNFGIVTQFTLVTHEQTSTYGAMLMVPGQRWEREVKIAIEDHIEHEKRKEAALEVAFKYSLFAGKSAPEYNIFASCIFDAPKPENPDDVPFKAFREIVATSWVTNPVGWDPVYSAANATYFVGPRAGATDGAANASLNAGKASDLGFREMSFGELHVLSDHPYRFVSLQKDNLAAIDIPSARAAEGVPAAAEMEDISESVEALDIAEEAQAEDEEEPSAKASKNWRPNEDVKAPAKILAKKSSAKVDEDGWLIDEDEEVPSKSLAEIIAELGSDNIDIDLGVFALADDIPLDEEPEVAEEEESGIEEADEVDDTELEVDDGIEEGESNSSGKAAKEIPVSKKVEQNQPKASPPISVANLGEMNLRGRFACIMVSCYNANIIEIAVREAERASQFMVQRNGRQVLIEVWPFPATLFDNSPPGAAWPHNPGDPHTPLIASFLWEKEEDDKFWLAQINESLGKIFDVALKEGFTRKDMPRYLNTSLEEVPVELIYGGEANVEKLGKVRERYDKADVMSLTGGFKIPL